MAKKNILLVGAGGVGSMAAFSLEAGGGAAVTAVLRSNYAAVVAADGFAIESVDHGSHPRWRPTRVVPAVPDVAAEGLPPYDFVVVATKNCPDIHPTVPAIIAPAVTTGHTVVVLVQNGLNIERPLLAAFPGTVVLSGVSLIGTAETAPGRVVHDEHDTLLVGPFVPGQAGAEAAARAFVDLYKACGVVDAQYNADVPFVRWRKLVYNGAFNPIAAIARMDTTRMRLAETPIAQLVRPAMAEIWRTARAAGHALPDDLIDKTVEADPPDVWCKPSMLQDAQKGNFIEYRNIVGEPRNEAARLGVPTPTLDVVFGFCQALQWQFMEAKGLVTLPAGAPPP